MIHVCAGRQTLLSPLDQFEYVPLRTKQSDCPYTRPGHMGDQITIYLSTVYVIYRPYRTTCLRPHSLSVLGWYIPGLSELPLGNRLALLLGGPSKRALCFLHFLLALSVLFARTRSTAQGRARRRRGCQRVLAGRGGTAVAAFVAGRCVCLETRGKHQWALTGLHLRFRI